MHFDPFRRAILNTNHQIHPFVRDHPFKTSAICRGGGVQNWSNLPTDSSKKLPTEGVGVKNSENLPTS